MKSSKNIVYKNNIEKYICYIYYMTKKTFTLLELVIVLLIIGALATLLKTEKNVLYIHQECCV